ncbi:MAG: DUF2206 domain-containing protein [Candidatus Bathyarchaeota archaeon]|nr:DUF2206 domain-containing protein [Candidatus Bathyarchaeota archaeon]
MQLQKPTAITIILIQLLVILSIVFNLPILRAVMSFCYLAFIPGFLLLTLIVKEELNWEITSAFSVALSLLLVMATGLLVNTLFSLLSIPRPLTLFPLVGATTIITLSMFTAALLRDRGKLEPEKSPSPFRNPKIHLLVVIPLLTIVGAELVNLYGNALLLLVLVVAVAGLLFASMSKRLIEPKYIPIVILVIAFFLLFHVSLSTQYLIGWDVHTEYYFAETTSLNAAWNPSLPHQYNSMLSITILPTTLAVFTGTNMQWIFKLFYPLIFTLVPVMLYKAYAKKISSNLAFLAAFFFMATPTFFVQMLGLTREIIGEFFLAGLIVLLVEDKINITARKILFLLFSVGLIFSHYALAYLLVGFLIGTYILSKIFKRIDKIAAPLVTAPIVLGCVGITYAWYALGTPAAFGALTNIIRQIYLSIQSGIPAPGIAGLTPVYFSPLHSVSTYLFLALQIIVAIGILKLLLIRRERIKFGSEFSSMAIVSMVVLILCMGVPTFAESLNASRFYHIAQYFLAPFLIVGATAIGSLVAKAAKKMAHPKDLAKSLHRAGVVVLSVILVSYFLFQVGFIYQVTDDVPTSIALSRKEIKNWPLDLHDLYVDKPEVESAYWVQDNRINQSEIYTDFGVRYMASYALVAPRMHKTLSPQISDMQINGALVCFGRLNIVYGVIEHERFIWYITDFENVFGNSSCVYANGKAAIYVQSK